MFKPKTQIFQNYYPEKKGKKKNRVDLHKIGNDKAHTRY